LLEQSAAFPSRDRAREHVVLARELVLAGLAQ